MFNCQDFAYIYAKNLKEHKEINTRKHYEKLNFAFFKISTLRHDNRKANPWDSFNQ